MKGTGPEVQVRPTSGHSYYMHRQQANLTCRTVVGDDPKFKTAAISYVAFSRPTTTHRYRFTDLVVNLVFQYVLLFLDFVEISQLWSL